MIQISESAQAHFRRLIEREALPGLGVRLSAMHPGTVRADVRLEFAEPGDLLGDEWAIDCEGFTLWLEAASVNYLDSAEIDYEVQATGGQLQIRAPKIKGVVPGESASLVERVHYVVENEINPHVDAWEEEGTFPAHELFKKMGSLGFLGRHRPGRLRPAQPHRPRRGLPWTFRCRTSL